MLASDGRRRKTFECVYDKITCDPIQPENETCPALGPKELIVEHVSFWDVIPPPITSKSKILCGMQTYYLYVMYMY